MAPAQGRSAPPIADGVFERSARAGASASGARGPGPGRGDDRPTRSGARPGGTKQAATSARRCTRTASRDPVLVALPVGLAWPSLPASPASSACKPDRPRSHARKTKGKQTKDNGKADGPRGQRRVLPERDAVVRARDHPVTGGPPLCPLSSALCPDADRSRWGQARRRKNGKAARRRPVRHGPYGVTSIVTAVLSRVHAPAA